MKLDELRKEIDEINEKLIELLGKRMSVAKQIAAYKKENNLPLYDGNREEKERLQIETLAKKHRLNPDFTAKLFSLYIEYTRLEMAHEMGQDS